MKTKNPREQVLHVSFFAHKETHSTPPKTNMEPEKWWLVGDSLFQGAILECHLSFRGEKTLLKPLQFQPPPNRVRVEETSTAVKVSDDVLYEGRSTSLERPIAARSIFHA